MVERVKERIYEDKYERKIRETVNDLNWRLSSDISGLNLKELKKISDMLDKCKIIFIKAGY